MPVYTLTYLINSIGFYANKKNRDILKIVVLLLLIFISGTRYYMGGTDVFSYENIYNGVPAVGNVLNYFFNGVNEGINENYEVGFLFLCSVIKSLGFSYFGFILIYTIIFYTLMVKGLEDFVPNWSVFFAAFMYKIMFYNTFISIRQGLTIAMFCYMLHFIRDRKWYFYFPWCYVAFLEHRAALILVPLYFITYIPTSKNFIKYFAIFMAPTWLIRERVDLSGVMDFITKLIQNDKSLEHWTESTETISIIHTLECYAVVVLIIIFYDKIVSNKREKEVRLVLQLFLITIPIFTLFSKWIFLTREKDYFVLMYGIIFGYILDGGTTAVITEETSKDKSYLRLGQSYYKIVSLAILAVCFIGIFRYAYTFDGGELMHFESFLFNNASIFANGNG